MSIGFAAPLSAILFAHGADHFYTGMHTFITGIPRETATTRLLTTTKIPTDVAHIIDFSIGTAAIAGTAKAVLNASRTGFLKLSLPEKTLTGANNTITKTSSRNRFIPDSVATGSHSVFRRDPVTGRVTHYETFRPQTNSFDPKPWESVIRFDYSGREGVSHFNKVLDNWVYEPHVHDPLSLGGIRPAEACEIPK